MDDRPTNLQLIAALCAMSFCTGFLIGRVTAQMGKPAEAAPQEQELHSYEPGRFIYATGDPDHATVQAWPWWVDIEPELDSQLVPLGGGLAVESDPLLAPGQDDR